MDQFSGWPHVVPFPNKYTSARRTIDATQGFFLQGGSPVKFWSDNDPQFAAAERKSFLSNWGVTAGTSAPTYAQSNGRAETAVKSTKKLIRGSWFSGSFNEDGFGKSLLFRNAPLSGGASPAELLFGRPVRDCLPAHRRLFKSEWRRDAVLLERRAQRSKDLRAEHFNRTAHPLITFHIADHVLIQHPDTKRWSTPGVIIEAGPNRDYLVKTAAGRVFRRNRRHLRKRVPVLPIHPDPVVPAAPPLPVLPDPPVLPDDAAALPEPPILHRRSHREKNPIIRYPAQEPGSLA